MSAILVVGGLITLIGVIIFIVGFKWFSKKRLIENMPTSKIRSLAMGLVEIKGAVVPIELLESPINKKKCVYYRFKVERERTYKDKEGNTRTEWVTIDQAKKDTRFYLKDDTAQVLVEPKDANVNIKTDFHNVEYRGGALTGTILSFVSGRPWAGSKDKYGGGKLRFTEWYIEPKDSLYILGTAGDNPYFEETKAQRNEQDIMIQKKKDLFFISDKSEKELLKSLKWKSILGVIFGPVVALGGVFILLRG
jgi:hypothetical protein